MKNINGKCLRTKGPKKKKEKGRKAKSSGDLSKDETLSPTASPPTVSRRKKLWDSFRKSTERIRGKSRERKGIKSEVENLCGSQPNIFSTSNLNRNSPDYDVLFAPVELQHRIMQLNGEHSHSDPSLTPQIADLQQDTLLQQIQSDSQDIDIDSEISVVENTIPSIQEGSSRQHQSNLLQHPFFQLVVLLQEGRDLVIRDSCGTSDPYVKFKIDSKLLHKSRIIYKNLNPRWEEKFTIPVEDVLKPLSIKVFDYDRAMHDDSMGSATIDLTTLEPNVTEEMKVMLSEKGKSTYMGYIILQLTLTPKTQTDKENIVMKDSKDITESKFYRRSTKLTETARKMKMQIWSSVVTVVLVEGKNLLPMDDNGFSDPYVKFRLGNEKYKSKFKPNTLNPRWLEQFDLRMYDDQTKCLELTVYDHDVAGKDDFMGRATIDLSNIKNEETHVIEQQLEDGAGMVKILLTISGTSGSETISDLANYTPNPREREEIVQNYGLLKSLSNLKDVGWLQVKVFKAQGLLSADIGGKSDPFCVVELVNSRLQTQTEYKTLNPQWNKIFTFNIKDLHSVLEVTVFDEDRDKKVEFLGKVGIPLLKIKPGERKWYALKDKKLIRKKKGKILIEMDIIFNHIKAAIRTVNPKEDKYMQAEQKFKISVMKRNINRVSQIVSSFVETGKFIQSCFDYESKPRSITAFIVYVMVVWNFELYMLPVTLLIIFIKNLIIAMVMDNFVKEPSSEDYVDDDEEEEEEDKEKEEKKSLKEKLQAIQEVCLQVQQTMDMIACLGERVKNTFNWSIPWLSTLAVIFLLLGAIICYLIPLRMLLLLWGINKFTKKLRSPNAIPNNEILDFLSRVPCDLELLQNREYRPENTINPVTAKKKAL
ncbi:multiple C2 and transmembrane domain-containing protein 1 isoform X3 [Octopus sinensis]|uniref:Multiple C2 and transmembrane domain-containing protein 1 isoform X3 n=1 Tax=Octopus sinensis TaxID=2607531 RepID=A0A7E6ERN7_9MOLL|nr:multiple C2 and transmembrane domain-containing protein 1 isoform X3 [Octopus sinensis]